MAKKIDPKSGVIYATQELLKCERFVGQVYLPAPQSDGMDKIIFANGNALFLTSSNFLEYECHYPNVICEPPKDKITEWTYRALDVAFAKTAFLLPVSFMETEEAKDLVDNTPLARVYILTKHLPFRRGGSAWFVWEKGNLEAPRIRWI